MIRRFRLQQAAGFVFRKSHRRLRKARSVRTDRCCAARSPVRGGQKIRCVKYDIAA
jgi:hypothetical protein